MADAAASDIAQLARTLRGFDRPRYYATLFAPQATRSDLLALYGFAAEIGQVPDLVSEPGLGEIRLQWWREGLEGLAKSGGDTGVPALRAIAHLHQRHALPIEPLLALIEARRADLYADPPPTPGDLEGRFGETESVLFQLGCLISGHSGPETADAAGHAGVAYGLSRRLARFAVERARGRTVMPLDLLAKENLRPEDVFAQDTHAELGKIVAALSSLARIHLRKANDSLVRTPKAVRPIFLPLAVVKPLLGRIEAQTPHIADRPVDLSDLDMLVRIGWARLRGFAR